MKRTGRKKAAAAARKRRNYRPNPHVLLFGANPARRVWTVGAERIAGNVKAIRYVHVSEGPRVHDFENAGVRMEGLPDGSIRIFHPTLRVWEDL